MDSSPSKPKRVADLENGDFSLDYGEVTHREGRKVWFESRIVTFTSEDDEIRVTGATSEDKWDNY